MARARTRPSLLALTTLALLILVLLSSPVAAASRASFCKCTCGRNGTIIPLDSTKDTSPDTDEHRRARTCADCNRQFCLAYDLPILSDCKAENRGKEEDIVATCFQRDSAKDQAVVYSFIIMTVGLLGYAGLKPYLDRRKDNTQSGTTGGVSGDYAPLPTQSNTLG